MNPTSPPSADEALRQAIRDLPGEAGPPAALDQRIRARAHAAVRPARRRRLQPLWWSAAASVFVAFFAINLLRHSGQAPTLESQQLPSQAPASASPMASGEADVSTADADAAGGGPERSEPRAEPDDMPLAKPAPPAEAEAQASSVEAARQVRTEQRNAPAKMRELAEEKAEQRSVRAPATTANRSAPQPEPMMVPPPAAPTPPAAPMPAAPAASRAAPLGAAAGLARPSDAPRAFADQEAAVGTLADDAPVGARERQPIVVQSAPAASKQTADPLAEEISVDDRADRSVARDEMRRDAGAAPSAEPAQALRKQGPVATATGDRCTAETAEPCLDLVRTWWAAGERERAIALLRDTLARFDLPPPEDLRELLR
ncbi:MAG: hypothetical protein KDI37_07035 [Xanthomonadales bacterium]|nr:hypothetical protein [Xanthomonadales bacterium]